jgi:hypothetical protein
MDRKKLTLIIIGALLFLMLIVILFYSLRPNPNAATSSNTSPTPVNVTQAPIRTENGSFITPVLTGASALMVVKTSPATGATGVDPSTKIQVEFNNLVNTDSVIFTIAPPANFKISSTNKVMTVSFDKPLATGTTYTFKVDPKETFPHTYTFTTTGPKPAFQPDTRPQGAAQIEDEFNKTNNPDIYLANRCPHDDATFSIDKQYNETTRRFDFIVIAKGDKTKAQDEVQTWLTKTGLSSNAINALTITYQ